MIEVKDLKFKYKRGGSKVFDGFNLSLAENRICGLLGKNGTGKSTLLYILCGLLRPQHGSVKVDGKEAKERDPEMLSQMYIVGESYSLPSTTLKSYVKVNKPFYPNFSDEILKKCLEEFELPTDGITINRLSMGQQKKLLMSIALASNTKYLFMDEPTNGLDIPSKAQFRKVVAENMTPDRTLIISTHQVHDIEQLLDHILIIDHNGIKMNQSVEEICDKYVFEYRSPQEMDDDVIYAEPTLQGNAVIAKRGEKPETDINLELLFDAVVNEKL